MATLYELGADLAHVIDGGFIVDEETGEVLFDADNLEELQAAFSDKLEACGLYLKNLHADAEAIRKEEIALAARRKTLERKAERMRDYVLRNLEAVGGGRIETPRLALSTRKSVALNVIDQGAVPREFVRVSESIDKAAAKKALKEGRNVPGVELVENTSLQVK